MRLQVPAGGMEPQERCQRGGKAAGRASQRSRAVGAQARRGGGSARGDRGQRGAGDGHARDRPPQRDGAQSSGLALDQQPARGPGPAAFPLSAAPYRGLAGVQRARASWYGWELAGRAAPASGERFSPEEFTAAHRSLPFGTRVRVIAPWSGEQVIVRINDRGPWAHERAFDFSLGAARAIGLDRRGVADVLVEVVDWPGAALTPGNGVAIMAPELHGAAAMIGTGRCGAPREEPPAAGSGSGKARYRRCPRELTAERGDRR